MPEFTALQPQWMVCTLPIAPSRIHSTSSRQDSNGVALVAHLRNDLVFAGDLGHFAALVDGVGQRLLAVDVLAAFHSGDRGHRVVMVGRGHHDGVDLLVQLVEHLAEVAELRGLGMVVEGADDAVVAPVDVAEGHDIVAAGHRAHVAPAHRADADAGDVQLLAGRRRAAAGHGVSRHDGDRRHGGPRGAQEFTTIGQYLLHDRVSGGKGFEPFGRLGFK